MKKVLIILLATAMITSMTACQQETTTPGIPKEPKQEISVETIKITEEVPDAYVQLGFNRTAKTNHADYFFTTELVSDGESLIRQSELILSKAMNNFNIQPNFATPITILYQKESPRYDGRGTTSTLRITPDFSKEEGRITYFLAQGKLPAWLCVGLERHWLAEAGESVSDTSTVDLSQWAKAADEKALPSFSDVWFIPNLIEDNLSNDKSSVAEQFVAYLDEQGQLEELTAAYLDPAQLDAAETLRRSAWEQVTGVKATDDGMTYNYMLDQYVINNGNSSLMFGVRTERANNYFSVTDWWTLEKIKDYSLTGNSSILTTEQWFDCKIDGLYNVMYLGYDPHEVGIRGMSMDQLSRTITVNVPEKSFPTGFSHEIVHQCLRYMGIENKGLYMGKQDKHSRGWMEDGLCHVVGSICDSDSGNPVLDKNYYSHAMQYLENFWGKECVDQYMAAVTAQGKDSSKLDPHIFYDLSAINAMKDQKLLERLPEEENNIFILLDKHQETIPSFYFYLLNGKGSEEDLMKAYQDISRFEEVYGQSLTDMIDEWLNYLETVY